MAQTKSNRAVYLGLNKMTDKQREERETAIRTRIHQRVYDPENGGGSVLFDGLQFVFPTPEEVANLEAIDLIDFVLDGRTKQFVAIICQIYGTTDSFVAVPVSYFNDKLIPFEQRDLELDEIEFIIPGGAIIEIWQSGKTLEERLVATAKWFKDKKGEYVEVQGTKTVEVKNFNGQDGPRERDTHTFTSYTKQSNGKIKKIG